MHFFSTTSERDTIAFVFSTRANQRAKQIGTGVFCCAILTDDIHILHGDTRRTIIDTMNE